MTQALRSEGEYILPETNIVELDGIRAPIAPSVISEALAKLEPEAPAKKKGGRPKGSRNAKAKKTRAVKPDPKKTPAPTVPETKIDEPKRRIAAGGDGVLSRVRRLRADQWIWILIPIAAIGLALSLAFLTGALKP